MRRPLASETTVAPKKARKSAKKPAPAETPEEKLARWEARSSELLAPAPTPTLPPEPPRAPRARPEPKPVPVARPAKPPLRTPVEAFIGPKESDEARRIRHRIEMAEFYERNPEYQERRQQNRDAFLRYAVAPPYPTVDDLRAKRAVVQELFDKAPPHHVQRPLFQLRLDDLDRAIRILTEGGLPWNLT
jgi:hypothetical protein